jgi:hypothetical protein
MVSLNAPLHAVVKALVDSGASINIIHEAIVTRLNLEKRPCKFPVKLTVADGHKMKPCDHYVTLNFTIDGLQQSEDFIVAPIGVHPMILGMPWLQKHNPSIDWRNRTFKQSIDAMEKSISPSNVVPLKADASIPNQATPDIQFTKKIRKNDQVHLIYISESHGLCGISLDQKHADATSEVTMEIPVEYHDLAKAFSKEEAEQLAPHRGALDHSIPLEEGSKPVFGPVYNLSEVELETLRKYINEQLAKGFIRPSTSPYGSPVLFVKKPSGALRLCVDYRALNKQTIKNRYPLPLISEMLDRVGKAKYFTKIDLRDAFNLIRCKDLS